MCVPADADGLGPAGYQAGDGLAQDRLAEDGSPEDVPDGAIGGEPHLLELELLHALLVRRDGGALDGNVVLQRGVGAVDGHLEHKVKLGGRQAPNLVLRVGGVSKN